jgi:peptide-methionine (R)-S-oxide reductase
MRFRVTGLIAVLVVGVSATVGSGQDPFSPAKRRKVMKSDREWAKVLTRPQYLVARQKETEPPYSGRYWNNHARGYYACVCCGAFLFSSATKFDSGTGWPSFYQPLAQGKIDSAVDNSTNELRIEVMCNDCGGHLGHVFNDGPPPTGLRYCLNSASLKFYTEAQVKAMLAKEKEDAEKAKKASEKTSPGDSKAKGDAEGKEAPSQPATKPEAGADSKAGSTPG